MLSISYPIVVCTCYVALLGYVNRNINKIIYWLMFIEGEGLTSNINV